MFITLCPEQRHRIGERLRLDVNFAKAALLEKTVLVAGDLNFMMEGETGVAIDEAPDQLFATAAALVRQMAARRQPLLQDLTDIHSSRLTHWSAETNAASLLDRVYMSTPGQLDR